MFFDRDSTSVSKEEGERQQLKCLFPSSPVLCERDEVAAHNSVRESHGASDVGVESEEEVAPGMACRERPFSNAYRIRVI